MDKEDLVDLLSSEGWSGFKFTTHRGLCAMRETPKGVVLVAYGLDEFTHLGSYSFEEWEEAQKALKEWDGGNDDIGGNWLTHQGSLRYQNPSYAKVKK